MHKKKDNDNHLYYIYIVIIVIGNKIFTGVAFLVPKSRFTKMYIDV